MKKLNNYQCIGLLFYGIFLFSNGLGLLPEFIKGLCVGFGSVLMAIGFYANNHDIAKFRNNKIKFFKRCFGK